MLIHDRARPRCAVKTKPIRAMKVAFALAATLTFAMPLAVLAQDGHTHAKRDTVARAGPSKVIVAGELSKPLDLDVAALAKMPRKSFKASAHGVEGEWEGVPLIDILRAAGAPVDDALRGKNLSLYVRISAADGYRVVYALAELDPKFRDDNVILADRRDGKPLAADEGPFRIIAPIEKRPGRWVRQVTRIDVLRAPD